MGLMFTRRRAGRASGQAFCRQARHQQHAQTRPARPAQGFICPGQNDIAISSIGHGFC